MLFFSRAPTFESRKALWLLLSWFGRDASVEEGRLHFQNVNPTLLDLSGLSCTLVFSFRLQRSGSLASSLLSFPTMASQATVDQQAKIDIM